MTDCIVKSAQGTCAWTFSIYRESLAATQEKSLLRSLRSSFLSWKDPHLPTFGQKSQHPLQHDEEPVRKADQEIDVHARPDNPRRKSGEAEHAQIGERIRAARDREIAFVPVPEWRRRRLSRHASSNQGRHIPASLNG